MEATKTIVPELLLQPMERRRADGDPVPGLDLPLALAAVDPAQLRQLPEVADDFLDGEVTQQPTAVREPDVLDLLLRLAPPDREVVARERVLRRVEDCQNLPRRHKARPRLNY